MSYAELHCHSNYSFKEGASSVEELLGARELEYPALALTDHDNLCGAMHFAQAAKSMGVQPITGVEATLLDGSRLTLLAATRKGYGNLCQLLTYSYLRDRKNPGRDPRHLHLRLRGHLGDLAGQAQSPGRPSAVMLHHHDGSQCLHGTHP